VFEAVISWINYEKESRLEHMAKLMEHVRLPLLPRDYLVQPRTPVSLPKVSRAGPFPSPHTVVLVAFSAFERSLSTYLVTSPLVMIVVGGQAPKAIRSVECYDFEEERWDQVAELPSRRCRAG
ncbi:KLHL3 protein, partial [Atlantisia rogersi]|nr:KLHL3 protein [Atlantisia rogersi]